MIPRATQIGSNHPDSTVPDGICLAVGACRKHHNVHQSNYAANRQTVAAGKK
jgi:hypothetical protein